MRAALALGAVTLGLVVPVGRGAAARAQELPGLEAAATMLLVDHRHALPEVGFSSTRGIAWGALARVRVGWIEATGEYAEGTMTVRGAPEGSVSLVEGRASLGVRMAPWLLVHAGPRAYELAGDVSRRIVSWQVGSELGFNLIPEVAWGFGGASAHLGGSADSSVPLGSGATAEVGLRIAPSFLRAWASATYRIERDAVAAAPGRDTTERLLLALGLRY